MLTFDEESHKYYWNGNMVPGVTSIISQFVKTTIGGYDYYVDTYTGNNVWASTFEQGADHGRAVHDAIKYDLSPKGVDEESLHPDIMAALNQFRAWRDEHVQEIISCEEMGYSEKYGYAGTWDLVVLLKRKYGGQLSLTDIKTGAHRFSGPQTAAYETIYREIKKYRGRMLRNSLEIPKDGNWVRYVPENSKDDFRVFLNKLAVFKYLSH